MVSLPLFIRGVVNGFEIDVFDRVLELSSLFCAVAPCSDLKLFADIVELPRLEFDVDVVTEPSMDVGSSSSFPLFDMCHSSHFTFEVGSRDLEVFGEEVLELFDDVGWDFTVRSPSINESLGFDVFVRLNDVGLSD